MICDIITYNGERELFAIRYEILKDLVDEFRVIEFDKTFSGKPRTRLFNQNLPKVTSYFITEDTWSKYEDLAKSSPNTQYGKGAEHWIREFCMKESIKDCLTDLKDEDVVFIGDCDEIYDMTDSRLLIPDARRPHLNKVKLRVYSYWLNNLSNEEFAGTLYGEYKHIKDQCLNHLRANSPITPFYSGWHFTSMGGHEKVKDKLTDSYTKDSYANDWVLDNLQNNITNNKDFLGRGFEYKIDEENWPKYLKENENKYKHLLRHE